MAAISSSVTFVATFEATSSAACSISVEASSAGLDVGMAAVMNLDRNALAAVCAEAASAGVVEMANFNCPGQVVISATKLLSTAPANSLRPPARAAVCRWPYPAPSTRAL